MLFHTLLLWLRLLRLLLLPWLSSSFLLFNTLSLSRFGVKGGGDNSLYLFLASEIIGRITFVFLRISALFTGRFLFLLRGLALCLRLVLRLNLIGNLLLQVCGQRLYLPIRL